MPSKPAKAAASRENGKRGGRPRKQAAIYPCKTCGHEHGDHQQRIGQRGNYRPCCVSGCQCSAWISPAFGRAKKAGAPLQSGETPGHRKDEKP